MKKTIQIIALLFLVLILLGGLGYLKKNKKFIFKEASPQFNQLKENAIPADSSEIGQKSQETAIVPIPSEEEKKVEDWLKKCEAGETIILAEAGDRKTEEISGKLAVDYLDDQEVVDYFLLDKNNKKQKFLGANWTEIDLLEGRQMVLQGEKKGEAFSPVSLRCLTSVGEKNTLEYRRKVMVEANNRIGEISGQQGSFGVESFWWQNDDYFYVDFFDKNDEEIYFEALVFVKKEGEKINFERVALSKNSGEEGDWELISGKDLFEEVVETEGESDENYYEFDESLKMWAPVY